MKEDGGGRFCSKKCYGKYRKKKFSGENSSWWKGGITPINTNIRASVEMRTWRKQVLDRDGYKCIWCNTTERLEADHIKPFCDFPELRFELSNGRTLCRKCHQTTETYTYKMRRKHKFLEKEGAL
jgi:hypothetical protein